jgi:tetratricopeptide (TPR) repeat protein
MIILLFLLILMIALSFYLAYSDYLRGRTYIGWGFLVVFAAIYLEFASLWFKRSQGATDMFIAVIACVFLLMTQGPLIVELISLAVMPDPSRGVKLVKVYTEAERKVSQDDLPGAILEYEKVIAEDPDDIVARFRLAELCHQNEEYRKSALAYEAILARKEQLSTSQHCSALTRLSDIYAERLNDAQTARKFVQTIIDEYPGTKYAGYAMDRLKNIQG